MKLTTETIRGEKIEIEVNTQTGKFEAQYNDEELEAPTKQGLVEILERVVAKAQRTKPIPVTVLGLVPHSKRGSWDADEKYENGDGIVQANLRGRHERNRVWLMETDDKKVKFQIGSYKNDGTIARRLTADECAEYLRLCEVRRAAVTALEDFVGSVKIDGKEALAAAGKKGE